ncbi:MAG TPA: hypothetical protein VGO47_09755 [Chlamydiales bacterium]|nr:hypothetical protein [Chlamydiales bacterium]
MDHSTRPKWISTPPETSHTSTDLPSGPEFPAPDSSMTPSTSLPTSREISSIPRTNSENWVYPSEAQFYAAMARKQQMCVFVSIHNTLMSMRGDCGE